MTLADEIAETIADWFGRSVIDSDRDLALTITTRGREQGRQEAIEELRKVAEEARYERDRDGARMCVRFLESTGSSTGGQP